MRPPSKLNIRQLEVFRSLVDAKTTMEAARWLEISQPAVSNAIASLEEKIGFKLFERQKKRLILTDEGSALYQEVDRLFRGIDQLSDAARNLASLKHGRLSLVLPQALVLCLVPEVIKRFRLLHPYAALTVEYLPSKEAVDHVAFGLVDLAIARLPVIHAGVRAEVVMRSETVCVLPPGHPLSAQETISPRDLEGEPLVLQSRRHEARFAINDAFHAQGIEPTIGVETGALTGACAYSAAGIGITIVDGLMANAFGGRDLSIRPFRPPIINEFAAVLPRDGLPSALASSFLSCIAAELAERPLSWVDAGPVK
jgi:DNA-binding transcriptional LysR family regulator